MIDLIIYFLVLSFGVFIMLSGFYIIIEKDRDYIKGRSKDS